MSTLGAGLLINKIVSEMENAIEVRSGKKEQAYKFIQYSAHDGTLHALFAALRLDSDHQEFRGKMNL